MLLSTPRLTSAVVSLRDFLGNSVNRAGVEYSNGGSAKWGMMSSNFEVLIGIGGGMVDNFPEPEPEPEVVAAATSAAVASDIVAPEDGPAADVDLCCCCCPRAEARRNN